MKMGKMIFVSNRLPVTVGKINETLDYTKSIGGLATGLDSYHKKSDSIWIGWPGISDDKINDSDKAIMEEKLKNDYSCLPVFLTEEDIEQFYHGFSNKTIWPLFHYSPDKVSYDINTWKAYKQVNRKFFDIVSQFIEDGDLVWVHDYQLMLLPRMIKDRYPNTKVGFFLHIPFPSYEIFRLLIWREEILHGLLGSDLIGFHTYDYVRHFLCSVRRLLGYDHDLNKINYQDRYVLVDAFPMGIDFERFSKGYSDCEDFTKAEKEILEIKQDARIILSIDRLDYTKGISERIKAFDLFLSKYPEYQGKVKLYQIVAPSRVQVSTYEQLKREITELISEVNGKYGTITWMPIWYYFKSFSQESLIAFYRNADVLLVTPLRDGMNLVAKEYFASRLDNKGMLVISETAGAASELGEAVVINPNDSEEIADSIKDSLEMSLEEKTVINNVICHRLKSYNVYYWANDFINSLLDITSDLSNNVSKNLEQNKNLIKDAYRNAKKRILFLDYDGTLVGFKRIPEQAKPDQELKDILMKLTEDPNNTVVIVSGRDRNILDRWFGDLNVHLIGAHGLWIRHPNKNWFMTIPIDNEWKESVRNILDLYVTRLPGSLIEEKEYSLAVHYRQCEPVVAKAKLNELKQVLLTMTASANIGLQEGNKVIEVKDNRVNKGYAALTFLRNENYDFILGAGDDFTDEDLFTVLPDDAYSIKIGIGDTSANYYLKSWESMRSILQAF
jgi:trehalose 6-phosphate synthase/phosphatase